MHILDLHPHTLIEYRSSELRAGQRLDSRDLLLYALVVLGAVVVVQIVGLFSPRSAASRLVQEHLHRLEDLRRRTSRAGGQGEAPLGVANRPVPRACLIVTDTDQLPPLPYACIDSGGLMIDMQILPSLKTFG